MQRAELDELTITPAETDSDLEAIVAIRRRVNPDIHPHVDSLRHARDSNPTLTFLVARLAGEPVGCGFIEAAPAHYGTADFEVVGAARRRGIGSRLLADISVRAREVGKSSLQCEVREVEQEAIAFVERRGYERVGAERAVSLELADVADDPPKPPPGVRVVSRAEESGLVAELYAVAVEAERDVPGSPGDRTFDEFRAELERPSLRREFFVFALAGDEPIGYAALHVFGNPKLGYHSMTAVRRAWRRRGVATALKAAHCGCEGAGAGAAHYGERRAEPAHAQPEREARLSAGSGAKPNRDARASGLTTRPWRAPRAGPGAARGHRRRRRASRLALAAR